MSLTYELRMLDKIDRIITEWLDGYGYVSNVTYQHAKVKHNGDFHYETCFIVDISGWDIDNIPTALEDMLNDMTDIHYPVHINWVF
jgi:hypothetical protein